MSQVVFTPSQSQVGFYNWKIYVFIFEQLQNDIDYTIFEFNFGAVAFQFNLQKKLDILATIFPVQINSFGLLPHAGLLWT